MNATGTTLTVEQLIGNRKDRTATLKGKSGNLYGGNFTSPKGDFARFLGYKPESEDEKNGAKMSATRTLEVAIQKEMKVVGEGAAERGMAYRNLYIAPGRYSNEMGRGKDMINDGLEAVNQSVERGAELNMRYLEMQYKFHLAGKNFSVVSNLMKVRHESVKKSMNDVR